MILTLEFHYCPALPDGLKKLSTAILNEIWPCDRSRAVSGYVCCTLFVWTTLGKHFELAGLHMRLIYDGRLGLERRITRYGSSRSIIRPLLVLILEKLNQTNYKSLLKFV